jgi:hypothetical protein
MPGKKETSMSRRFRSIEAAKSNYSVWSSFVIEAADVL